MRRYRSEAKVKVSYMRQRRGHGRKQRRGLRPLARRKHHRGHKAAAARAIDYITPPPNWFPEDQPGNERRKLERVRSCNGGNDQRIDGDCAVAGYGAGSGFRFR